MKNLNSKISEVIKKYRLCANLSQEDLAGLADIHRTYISQIERGLKMPTLAILFKIANALKIEPSQLVKEIERDSNDLQG